jgi:hypothetical protein
LADTADLYVAAAAVIERAAAAYVSGVPEDTADDGLFGPASVTWQVSNHLASPVAGLRSLLMRALHPLAMAGVDQHRGWRRDPSAGWPPPRHMSRRSPLASGQRPRRPRYGASVIMPAGSTR